MSQRNVEQVIGKLVTDEGFRRRFADDPKAALAELVEGGLGLNPCEMRGLLALDARRIERFADTLHPCIQKVELSSPGVENDPRRSTIQRTGTDGERDRDPERPNETGSATDPETLGDTP
jgi:hypothetical protein